MIFQKDASFCVFFLVKWQSCLDRSFSAFPRLQSYLITQSFRAVQSSLEGVIEIDAIPEAGKFLDRFSVITNPRIVPGILFSFLSKFIDVNTCFLGVFNIALI